MLVWHAETAQDFFDWISKATWWSEDLTCTLPLALCCDGFFVTHTKDVVNLTPADMSFRTTTPTALPCLAWTWNVHRSG